MKISLKKIISQLTSNRSISLSSTLVITFLFSNSIVFASSFNTLRLDIKGKKTTRCTASMYKLNNRCMTFTPAHCLKEDDVTKLKLTINGKYQIKSNQVLIDETKDVALINFENFKMCNKLENTPVLSIEQYLESKTDVVAIGYLEKQYENDSFNYPLDGKIQSLPVFAELNSSFIEGNRYIKYSYIKAVPGMSGGTLLDKKSNTPLGMIVRSNIIEDEVSIVALIDLAKMIHTSQIDLIKEYNYQFTLPKGDELYRNRVSIPRDLGIFNSRQFSLGDNGDADIGDTSNGSSMTVALGDILRPRFEGIIPPEDIINGQMLFRRKLIAVRCNTDGPWEQINGYNSLTSTFKSYGTEDCLEPSSQALGNKIYSKIKEYTIEDIPVLWQKYLNENREKLSTKGSFILPCDQADCRNEEQDFKNSIFHRFHGIYKQKANLAFPRHSTFERVEETKKYRKIDVDSILMDLKVDIINKNIVFIQDSQDRLDFGMNSYRVKKAIYNYHFTRDGEWIILSAPFSPMVLGINGEVIPGLRDEYLICKNDSALELHCISNSKSNSLTLSLKESKSGQKKIFFSISSSLFNMDELSKKINIKGKLLPSDFSPILIHKLSGLLHE